MDLLLEQIDNGELWQFPGGIHPPEQKSISNLLPIGRLPLPDKLVIPIKQHIGANGVLLVKVGDRVLKGQALTQPQANWSLPVHAPTSGFITAIKPAISAHPSALPELSVIIEPDGEEQWIELQRHLDFAKLDKTTLVDIIHNAGIAGMGGAGFPTYIKADTQAPIEYLIVNGVECEPYITADDTLMREYATNIANGIAIMKHLLSPKRVLVAIEDNKPDALQAMTEGCKTLTDVLVRSIPTKYPSGGEKQLIKVLTSKEVPSGGIPADVGVIVQNVGTLFAISEAITEGKPLIERVVTVTGNTIRQKRNVWALIGTEIKHLLDNQGFNPVPEQRVIMGGPMMGFTLPSVRIPVVKTTNCILAPDNQELAVEGEEKACIRCSACADACPQTLLPQQLQWFAKGKEYQKLEEYSLFDCIECGACSYVCPSEIPLVQYYRVAKAEIREQKLEKIKAERAKERFELRKARLEREMEERQNRHKKAAQTTIKSAEEKQKVAEAMSRVAKQSDKKDAVAEAIARAKARKAQTGQEMLPDNSKVVQERARRKEEARRYKEQKEQQTHSEPKSNDPKKEAIALAIARAKAKKAAQTNENDSSQSKPCGEDKKAAVAAAIARAKAKKAAQQPESVNDASSADAQNIGTGSNEPDTADDKRKAAVAAAIARAKAKKVAQQPESVNDVSSADAQDANTDKNGPDSADDKRKAAVAAAIARAKAKKAAQQPESVNDASSADAQDIDTDSNGPDSADDKRKAAVAAAIARAKAKKAAQQRESVNDATSADAQDVETDSKGADTADDKRKAAVAAAISRAKAKKAALAAKVNNEDGNETS
ncbi:Electron transport complex protein RnfC [Pseudoalteromonas luteoviolacea B = ATCC 29581]|nr:Electron transport complex protein RnfC [Pseudoalteromonas luteoviolacea B = ATCC 29581]